MDQLSEPAILVTGAAKRLGKATAMALADAGYDIILHYNQSNDEAQETASEIASRGTAVALLQHDLADTASLPSMMQHAAKLAPNLVGLVNSAAIFEPCPFTEMTMEHFHNQMAINAFAPIWLAQAYANIIGKGTIINFLDNYIHKHQTRFFSYLLSKKLLHEATLMLAANVGKNIRVHGVCPGVALPSIDCDEAQMKARILKAPIARATTPEEIAQTILWLIEAEHLTGQIIMTDGGENLCW